MTTEYDGKHVVITGASGGLGGAVVDTIRAAGGICHLPLHQELGPEHAQWQQTDGIHLTEHVDLTVESTVESYFQGLPTLWASIHLVGGFAMAPVEDTTLKQFVDMFTLNAQTCFLCCREAVKSIRGSGHGGRIVNVAARPAVQPVAGMLAYGVSKTAVVAMTRSLAVELHADQILINAIIPSVIDTGVNREAMPDADFRQWPKPSEIAESITFLASPQNQVTSGSMVPVYGKS